MREDNLAYNNLYTLHFSTGYFPPSSPDPFLEHICAYREVLRDLAGKMMEINWRRLKDPSDIFDLIDSQLRDVIKNLADLGDDPMEDRIDMTNVMSLLYRILVDWYAIADLSDLNDSARYEKIANCHQQMRLAIQLLTV